VPSADLLVPSAGPDATYEWLRVKNTFDHQDDEGTFIFFEVETPPGYPGGAYRAGFAVILDQEDHLKWSESAGGAIAISPLNEGVTVWRRVEFAGGVQGEEFVTVLAGNVPPPEGSY
jgi:hypothetical protein